MRRRDFLHNTSHMLASSFLFKGLAASSIPIQPFLNFNPDNNHVLVLIFLNGGNDGLNTVIPIHQYDVLSQLRPHVLIPENKVLQLPDTNGLGLHPSLKFFKRLYQENRLKIVRGVGYPEQNFSHFRSTDIWMSGANSDELIPTGMLGRYLDGEFPGYPEDYPNDVHTDPLAVELGYANSLLFQGPVSNMSLVINGEADFYQLIDDQIGQVPDSVYADKLKHVKLIRSQSQTYGKVVKDAAEKARNKVEYPDTWIASQLKIVSRLIAGGLKTPIYKVELDGFDTHASQVETNDTTTGQHAYLLQQLDEALSAFMQDLESLGIADRVSGMTFSEFGRRIISNASNGTDHGAAGPMFFFGNAIQGGVLGNDYAFNTSMNEADNLPYQYDFRQTFSTALQDWLCVDGAQLGSAMMRDFNTLPVFQSVACSPTSTFNNSSTEKIHLKVYPNPADAWTNLAFQSDGNPLQIQLVQINGQVVRTVASGKYPSGKHQMKLDLSDLPSGHYYIQLLGKQIRQAKMIQKQ